MKLSSYIEKTYKDKLTIIRYVSIENADGTTGEVQDPSEDLVGIPCRISMLKPDERNGDTPDADDTYTRVKIFLNPKVRVSKSDRLIADQYLEGVKVQSFEGRAGDPFIYDLSQEVVLVEKRVKANV